MLGVPARVVLVPNVFVGSPWFFLAPWFRYGVGSPLNSSRAFSSRVADHILEEALELTDVAGRFRQFPDTFADCAAKK